MKHVFKRAFLQAATWTLVFGPMAWSSSQKAQKNVNDELKPVKGNEKENDIRALKTEMLVAKSEAEAMKQLDRLLNKYRGTAMEPGLWLRKAELYVRQSKTERFFEVHRDSETVVSLAPQKISKASSKKPLEKAVETYEMIYKRFPNFNELDVVLFNNAFTRQQLNQDRIAENLYRELLRRFSDSYLVPDSHLALGEMLFERKAFQEALVEFEAIKKYPESRVYPYGIYKSAWAKYNLHDTEGGLRELEAVVAFGVKVEKENLDAKLDLRAEALSDMILFFSDIRNSADAYSYFKKQGGEKMLGSLLLKLSGLYVRHSKFADHQKVLNDLIAKNPEAAEVPAAYKSLTDNYEVQRDRKSAVATLNAFDESCEAGKIDKSCREVLPKTSLIHANKWHRMWSKNPTYPEFAAVAETAYQLYLKYESKGEESLENRHSYAEILFQQKKYRKASEQYGIVAKSIQNPTIAHDAGYSSIVSLEKSVGDKWNDYDEKEFIALSTVYLTRNANGKYVSDVKFKRAFIAYEKGRYEEAGSGFKELGWTKKDTAYTEKSQMLYLDILNIQKDYTSLKDNSAKLLAGSGLSSDRRKQIQKIHDEAWFSECQKLEEKGNLEAASEGYQSFAKTNPQSALADKAAWNAIRLYTMMGMVAKGTEMSLSFAKAYPKSEYSKDALLKAVQGFEQMADLKKAADALVVLSERDTENLYKWKSLAADFYALSNYVDVAKGMYREMTKAKDSTVSQAAYAKLTLLDEQTNKNSDLKLAAEIVSTGMQPQAGLAQVKIAEMQLAKSQYSDAFRSASRVLEMGKIGASKNAQARARMIQATILENEFVQQSVKSRGERLALVLQIKTEKLDKATQAYQDVIRYGDSETSVRALRKIASVYEKYIEALRGIELVGSYTKEEVAALRKELESLALPIEDKRADTLTEALKQAKRLDLRDGTVGQIQSDINRLNMKKSAAQPIQIRVPDLLLPRPQSFGVSSL